MAFSNAPNNIWGKQLLENNIIKKCDNFILLTTDDAIESKWCNWELEYGDANKFRDRIALFPLNDKELMILNIMEMNICKYIRQANMKMK